MDVIIKSHHVNVSDALKDYARKKMDKLEHFFDHIQDIVVYLNIEHSRVSGDLHTASAVIHLCGTIITAKETTEDMYSSIDLLLDKLSVQLRRYKDKRRHHKGHASTHDITKRPDENRPVVEEKPHEMYIRKPMGVEDALNVLIDKKLNFLVFRNLHEHVCVIYPDDQGAYGLIET